MVEPYLEKGYEWPSLEGRTSGYDSAFIFTFGQHMIYDNV
jgi:hypothetical protein